MSFTGDQWARVLYNRGGGLPDNYTPEDCFLEAIQRNKNVRKFSFVQCMIRAAQVALQLNAVVAFLVTYVAIGESWLQSPPPATVAAVSAVALLCYALANGKAKADGAERRLKHVTVFFLFGSGLAPVLYKLTDTISTDSILTMSLVMLFLHLLLHDYDPQRKASTASYASSALSLNAALFGSVCLASRLGSSLDAFALLTVSVMCFVLFPRIRSRLEDKAAMWLTVLTSALAIAASLAVSLVSGLATAFLLGFVLFLSPYLFVRWLDYKHTIHGPWDEAVPNMSK